MNVIHFFVVILVAIAMRNPIMSGAQPIGNSDERNTFQRLLSRNAERIERVLRSQYGDEDVKMRVIPTSGYDAATGRLAFVLDLAGEERASITSAQLWVEAKNEEIIRSLLRQNREDRAAYVLKRHGSDEDEEEETDYDDDDDNNQNSSSPTLLMIKIEDALKEKQENDETPLTINLTAGMEIVSACIAVFWTHAKATPTLNMLVDETFLGRQWEQVVDYEDGAARLRRKAMLADYASPSCKVTYPRTTRIPLPGSTFINVGECQKRSRHSGENVCLRDSRDFNAYIALVGRFDSCPTCIPSAFRSVSVFDKRKEYFVTIVTACTCTVMPCAFDEAEKKRAQAVKGRLNDSRGYESSRDDVPWENYIQKTDLRRR